MCRGDRIASVMSRPILAAVISLLLAAAGSGVAAQSVPTITTIAGGGPHDVPALSAWISPDDLVVDAAGNIWFPSRFRHRIYKIDTGGILRLVAGTGIELRLGDGGPISRASFLLPDEIALTPAGDLLVYGGGDAYGCCSPDFDHWNRLDLSLRRLNFGTGAVESITSSLGLWPDDLIVSPGGMIFASNHGLFTDAGWTLGGVDAIDPVTGARTHLAGNYEIFGGPLDDGMPGTQVSLLSVGSIAWESSGDILLNDGEHHAIRNLDLSTGIIDSYAPASGLSGNFAFDGAGDLYVTGYSIIRRIDAVTGAISVVAGTGMAGFSGDGGPATAAQIRASQLAFDAAGNLFLTGEVDGRIRRIDHDTGVIETVAGDPSIDRYGDGGPATQALVRLPIDVAVAPSGDLFIAEAGYTAVRKVDATTGEITALFRGAYGDIGTSNTSPPSLTSVAYHDGGVYYAQEALPTAVGYVNAPTVRRYDLATGQITRIAGLDNFTAGCDGEGGPADEARLDRPKDLIFDAAGNLFIADAGTHHVLRVDAASGILTRVAGITGFNGACSTLGGFNGDGLPGVETQLNFPTGLAVDGAGDLIIADSSNHRIRLLDAGTGIITTIAGTGENGFSGDGGPALQARLSYPGTLALDGAGNLYFADAGNLRIRRVDAVSGIITTVAGDGVRGFYGDGGPAALAGLSAPAGMAFDAAGDLLVADWYAGRIRKIDLPSLPVSATATATPAILWPPNHQMVPVHVDVDVGSAPGPVTIALLSISSSEPDDAPGGGDGETEDDIQGSDPGTADFDFELRAERSGGGTGRVYTIVYSVTTEAGISSSATAFVTVPHDVGGVIDPMTLSIQETASGSVLSWAEVPGANSYSVVRGEIGDLDFAADAIDLGSVTCIESRSKDLTTIGDEDAEIPPSGRAWFYLVEYRDPKASSYGSAFVTRPRLPESGDCN